MTDPIPSEIRCSSCDKPIARHYNRKAQSFRDWFHVDTADIMKCSSDGKPEPIPSVSPASTKEEK